MKTLYLDCGMGAAGDMLTASLYELLSQEEKKDFIDQMNHLGIPGVEISAEEMVKCGITGTHMKVVVNGEEEESHDHHHEHDHSHEHHHDHEHDHNHEHHHDHDHHHEHSHEHHHHHSHNSMHNIEHTVEDLKVSERVKSDIIEVYKLIAEAESDAHGVPVSQIHFHEVGTMDAVADITAVCLLMEKLGVEKVVASPIHVGSGHVHCAHGILPVPAPATAYILKGLPIYGGEIQGELCTPTGAALLKHFVNEYSGIPNIHIDKIGYGMGKKDFAMANCLRSMIGSQDDAVESTGDIIDLLALMKKKSLSAADVMNMINIGK